MLRDIFTNKLKYSAETEEIFAVSKNQTYTIMVTSQRSTYTVMSKGNWFYFRLKYSSFPFRLSPQRIMDCDSICSISRRTGGKFYASVIGTSSAKFIVLSALIPVTALDFKVELIPINARATERSRFFFKRSNFKDSDKSTEAIS